MREIRKRLRSQHLDGPTGQTKRAEDSSLRGLSELPHAVHDEGFWPHVQQWGLHRECGR